jgi:rubredoxin
LRTKITDKTTLIATLRDLGIAVKTEANIRGFEGQSVRADVVAVLEGDYDIGWQQNADGSYNLVANLYGIAKKHNHTELVNAINQKYALIKTLSEIKRSGSLSSSAPFSSLPRRKRCPRCDSTQNVRYGSYLGKNNYKCSNCGTQFIES